MAIEQRNRRANVLVVTNRPPFQSGGAERLASTLVEKLNMAGFRADLVELPQFQSPIEQATTAIRLTRLVDISDTHFGQVDRVITLKYPAYFVRHPHKVLWLLHQYRQMYELWDDPSVGFEQLPAGEHLRAAVREADRVFLPEHRRLFAISQTVRNRLEEFSQLNATVLYPPLPDGERYFSASAEDFFLAPGRLMPLKRQSLLLEALRLTRQPVRILFCGHPDSTGATETLTNRIVELKLSDRSAYLGVVPETDKRELFARARGILFPSRLEDYGFVTLEAMASAKPIITCCDSGGVLEFVTHGENGLVVEPSPEALADALDTLWCDTGRARAMGEAGLAKYLALNLNWDTVVDQLLG